MILWGNVTQLDGQCYQFLVLAGFFGELLKSNCVWQTNFDNSVNNKLNFFFLSGFSFTTIHESHDRKGREREFL